MRPAKHAFCVDFMGSRNMKKKITTNFINGNDVSAPLGRSVKIEDIFTQAFKPEFRKRKPALVIPLSEVKHKG